jgi:hypothetical protein
LTETPLRETFFSISHFFSAFFRLSASLTFIIIQFSSASRLPILHPRHHYDGYHYFTTTFEKDANMDIALSQVTKLEGIATQDNGNYRQFNEF